MDRNTAIELLEQEKRVQAQFVNMTELIGIRKEYGDKGLATIEALDLAIEALQTMRCGDCKHYDLVCDNDGNEWEVCKRDPEEYRWFEVKAMDIMCEKGEVRE